MLVSAGDGISLCLIPSIRGNATRANSVIKPARAKLPARASAPDFELDRAKSRFSTIDPEAQKNESEMKSR